MADARFATSGAGTSLPSVFGQRQQQAFIGPLTKEQSEARFAQPAQKPAEPEKKDSTFEAIPGAFEQLYPETQADKMKRMFGREDPVQAYFDRAPLARLGQGKDKFMSAAAERIGQYVSQNPEDRDLLNPAPLASWAKSIGKSLLKVPFRVARFAGKYAIDENPFNPMAAYNRAMDNLVIPDSMFRTPTVEDTVTKIAAYVGLPLDKAQEVMGEKPTILQSLYNGFVQPVKDGFQIASMPNGPEKEEAFDAWAYKTHQSFVSGLTMGVLDDAMKENSIWLENGELMWRGVPIDDLSELENKGVRAGQLTGQLGGSVVTYALMTPMLTAQMRNVQALDQVYRAHPYLASAVLTNAAQEGLEAVVRKSSGQEYTFNDTLIGMMSGIAFETGKLASGGYKVDVDAPDFKSSVDLDSVRSFLDGEVRAYTLENGHTPDVNDLRAQIGDKVIPGTEFTVNELHTMMARSGIKEARLIEYKGGKQGTPGIDYPAPLPEPKPDAGRVPTPDIEVQPQTKLLGEFFGTDGATIAKDIADMGTDIQSKPNAERFTALAEKYGKPESEWSDFVDKKLGDNATPADYDAIEVARIDAEKIPAAAAAPTVKVDEADVKALTEAQKKYMPNGGSKEQFRENVRVAKDPEAPRVIAQSKGEWMQEAPQGKVATRVVHFDELYDIVKNKGLVPEHHPHAATPNTLGFDTSADDIAIREAGLYNPANGPSWRIQTDLSNIKNPDEIVLTGGAGVETKTGIPIDKLYITGPGFGDGKTPPPGPTPVRVPTPDGGDGRVKQVFRTDKFNLDDAGQARLKSVQEALGMTTRDVRSWAEVSKMAKEIGADPMKLMKRVTDSKLISDVEVEALRQNVQSAATFLSNKFEMLEEARKSGDTRAIAEVEQKMAMNEKLLNDSLKKLVGGGTEVGRAVAVYRKIADLKMEDPTYWYKEAMKLIDDGRKSVRFGNKRVTVDNGQLPGELRQAIDSMMKNGDQLGMAQLMAQLKRTPNVDKVVKLWKAGLLTAPTTDLANILGNTSMMALETVKDAPATVMDILMTQSAKASNRLFGTNFSEVRVKTNTLRMLAQQAAGLYEGAGKAKEYLFTGVDADNIAAKYDISNQVNYNNAVLQGYTEAVFRKLGAEDLVYRYGFIRRSLMESAELRVQNMSPQEISSALDGLPDGAPRTKAELVRQFFKNPSDAASTKAINDAEYGTFQRNNTFTDAISAAKNASNPALRGTLEFIAPFTRTPTNVGLALFDYTPAGFLKELAMQIRSPDKARFVNSFGRSVVGTSVIALGAMLHKEGLMTGNAPETEAERKLWEAERKQPNSVYFMGQWHKLDRISPIGNLLTIGAEFNELGERKTTREQWTQIGFEGIKSVTEQSFLLGFSNALKAVTEPDRFAETFVENAIRGIVPNIIAKVGSGMDDYERDVGTLNPLAVLQERIPILRESLPRKQDVLGRDIKMQGGVLGKLFNPFSSRTPSANPVLRELQRLEQPISAPNRSLYSDEEFNALVDLRGKMLMPSLEAMFQEPGYADLTPEQQREAVKQIDAVVTRTAHEQFRMVQAQRIYEELSTLSPSDRTKKMNEIKKKNNTVYTLIQILDASNAGN